MSERILRNRSARAVWHFVVVRGREVVLLQATPFLGALLGASGKGEFAPGRAALLVAGSVLLTAHIFVFNDWAGQGGDVNDPKRAAQVFGSRGIGSRQVAGLAIALLAAATFVFAVLGIPAVFFGTAIAALGLLYSGSVSWGKGRPLVASLLHVAGGICHFLLGYALFHRVDFRGVTIGIFFGLVFAAGHLNQEVRDYDADRRNQIRTTAVAFGCRRTFVGSVLVFTGAYLLLVVLAAFGMLSPFVLLTALLWPWHLACAMKALRKGVGSETAVWMQQRYRIAFAFVGVVMFFSTPPVAQLVFGTR